MTIALYPHEAPPRFNPQMARAIEFLVAHFRDQPSLDSLAEAAGMSPFHFQRTFKHWAGISPKRFIQFVTVGHAKQLLDGRASVLDTALEVGLSGPSRLHDLFVACEAMTPGEYKDLGKLLTIRWGIHEGPLGRVLLAATDRGVCWLSFVEDGDDEGAFEAFAAQWPAARLVEDHAGTAQLVAKSFALGKPGGDGAGMVPLHIRGTNFQVKVWEALLRIPAGAVVSYHDIAQTIGQPNAVRAVGQACRLNPLAYIIPCHRVIRKSGLIHGYRWGASRKRALIAYEAAEQLEQAAADEEGPDLSQHLPAA